MGIKHKNKMRVLTLLVCLLIAVQVLGQFGKVGGMKDKDGCLKAAGYQYCKKAGICVRLWEHYECLKDHCANEPVRAKKKSWKSLCDMAKKDGLLKPGK